MENNVVGTTRQAQSDSARPTIGLLIDNAVDPIAWEVWAGAEAAARQGDANLMCVIGGALRSQVDFTVQDNVLYDLINDKNVDGLVVWAGGLGQFVGTEELRAFCERYEPMPVVSASLPLEGMPSVWVDNYVAMRQAVAHLVEVHGYQRIAFARGPKGHPEAEDRYRAYVDVLEEHGLVQNPSLVVDSRFHADAGKELVHMLLDERGMSPRTDLDAIVAINDAAAIRAVQELQARGVRVPQDVAVIGFDNAEGSDHITPPLTTAPSLAYEQANQAVEIVLNMLSPSTKTAPKAPEQVTLPAELIVRQSCGCLDPAVAQVVEPAEDAAPTFATILTAHRTKILFEMVHAAGPNTEGLDARWAEHLLAAFAVEVGGEAPGAFLSTLERTLSRVSLAGGDISAWQDVLSRLRQATKPSLSDNPRGLSRAENLWQQARVLTSGVAERAAAYRAMQTSQHAEQLRQVDQALMTAEDLSKLAQVLVEELPGLGIDSFYLSLYEGATSPAEWSELILACRDGQAVDLGSIERRFPSVELTPDGLYRRGRRYSMVLDPLRFENRPLGLLLLELGPRKAEIHAPLPVQISSALQRTLLVQEAAGHSVQLQQGLARNARLLEERERRITELSIVNEIGQALVTALELDELLEAVHQQVVRLFDTTNYYIATYQESSDKWFSAFHLEEGERQPTAWHGVETGLTGYILRHRQPLLLRTERENTDFHEEQGMAFLGIMSKSWMGVPLIAADKIVGVMAIQSYEHENLYSGQDQALFATVAAQVATALDNLRLLDSALQRADELGELHAAAQEQAQRRALLNEMSEELTRVASQQDILNIGVAKTGEIFDAERVSLAMLTAGGDQFEIYALHGAEGAVPMGVQLLAKDRPIGRAVQERRLIIVPDDQSGDLGGIRSSMTAPLITSRGPIGTLNVGAEKPDAYSEDDGELLLQISSLLSAAIENLRLLEETQQRLSDLTMLSNVSGALSGAPLQAEEIASIIARQFVEVMGVSEASVSMLDEAQGEMRLVVDLFVGEDGVGSGERDESFPVADYPAAARVMDTLEPLVVHASDPDADPAQLAHIKRGDVSTLVIIPLAVKGRAIGVVELESGGEERHYTEEELGLALTMANQAAVALDNARLFEQEQQATHQLGQRVQELNILNDIGRKIDETLPIVEFLDWLTDCIPAAMQDPNLCVVAAEYEGQLLGVSTAAELPWQMVQSLQAGGRQVGKLYVAYTEEHDFLNEESALLGDITRRVNSYIENQQLLDETQRQLSNLDTIQSTMAELTAALTFEEAIDVLLPRVADSARAGTVTMYLVEGDYMNLSGVYSTVARHDLEIGQVDRLSDHPLTKQVLDTRRPLMLMADDPRLQQHAREAYEARGIAASVTIPLVGREGVVGFLALHRYKPGGGFTNQEILLVQTLADQATVAIEKSRLLEQIQYRTVQLQTAAQVSRAASSILSVDELVQESVNLIRDRFDFYYVGLFLVNGGGDYAVLRAGTGEPGRVMVEEGHKLLVGGESMIGWSIAEKRALIALDVGEEAVRFENPRLPDTRSEMALPLISRGEVQGALTVQSAQPAAFSEEEVTILQTMADQLANAIGNATLFAQAQRSAQLSQALYETSGALSTHLEEEPLLRTIVEGLYRTLDCELVSVSIVDEHAGTIGTRHILWQGEFDVFPEWIEKSSYPLDHADIIADIYRSGQTEIIGEWDDRFNQEIWDQFGHERLLRIFTPIKMRDRVLGVIEVAYEKDKKQVVGEDDVEVLTAVADQLASALEQARLFGEAQSRARREQVLREITNRVRGSTDPDTIMRTAVREVGNALGRPTFVRLGGSESLAQGSGDNGGGGQPFQREAETLGYLYDRTNVVPLDPGFDEEPAILTPLSVRGQAFGVLGVQADPDAPLSADEMALVESVAEQVSQALESARLFQQTQTALAETEDLYKASADMAAAQSYEGVVAALRTHSLLGEADHSVNIYLFDRPWIGEQPPEWIIAAEGWSHSTHAGYMRHRLQDFQSLVQILQSDDATIISDLRSDQQLDDKTRDLYAIQYGARCAVFVPLVVGEQRLGYVDGLYSEPVDLSDTEVRRLTALVAQAAVTVQNLRQLELTQARAERERMVRSITDRVRRGSDRETIVKTALQELAQMLGASKAVFRLGTQAQLLEGQVVALEDRVNVQQHLVREPAEASTQGYFLLNDQDGFARDIWLPGMTEAVQRSAAVAGSDPETDVSLALPILLYGEVIGALGFGRDGGHTWTREEIGAVETIAEQIGWALEGQRLFDEEQQARALLGMRVYALDCLNDIGRRIDEAPPVAEFMPWVAARIPPAMQFPDLCRAAIEFDGDTYGAAEASGFARQIVQGLYIGGEKVGRVIIAYTEDRAFPDEESSLLGDIARRVGGYVENRRLIQETQQAAQELGEERTLLRTLIDTIPDLIYIKDAEGRFILNNQAHLTALGATSQEKVVGKTDMDIFPSEFAEQYSADEQELFRTGEPLHGREEPVQNRAMGEIQWILTTKVPLRDRSGQVVGLVGVGRDITERRQADVVLERRRAQLECLSDIGQKIGESPPVSEFLDWAAARIPSAMQHPDSCIAAIRFNGDIHGASEAFDLPAQIVQSMDFRGEQMGRICIAYTEELQFIDEESALLGDIARRLGGYIENRRLFELERIRAEEQVTLRRITEAVSSSLEMETLMGTALETLISDMGFDAALVSLSDEKTGRLYLAAEQNLPDLLAQKFEEQGLDNTLCDHVFRTGKALCIDDVRERAPVDVGGLVNQGLLGYMGALLTYGGESVGTVCCFTRTVRSLTPEEMALLEAVGAQIGVGMANARLYQQEQVRAEEQATLRRITEAVSGSLDVQTLMGTALGTLISDMGFDAALISLSDERTDRLFLAAQENIPEVLVRKFEEAGLDDTLCDYVYRTGEAMSIDDVRRGAPVNVEGLANQGLYGYMGALMTYGGESLGTVCCFTRTVRRMTLAEQALLENVGAQIGVGIANARLFEQEQVRAEEQATLRRITEAVSGSLDLQALLGTALETLISDMHFDAALISLTGEETDRLFLAAEKGLPDALVRKFGRDGLGGTLCEYVFETGETTCIDDVRQGAPVDVQGLIRLGLYGYMGALLTYSGERLGTVCCFTRAVRQMTLAEMALLEGVGSQIGVGIANARLFEETQAALAEVESVHRSYLRQEWQDHLREQAVLGQSGFLYDEATAGPANEASAVPDLWFPEMERALEEGRLATVQDGAGGERAGLAMPITIRGETIGVLGVEDLSGDRQWTAEERALIEAVGEQLGQALESARLYSETRLRAEQGLRVREITDQVRSALDLEQLAQTAAEELAKTLGASHVAVRLRRTPSGDGESQD